jgi:Ca2+-binding EF-hand superfamily protein
MKKLLTAATISIFATGVALAQVAFETVDADASGGVTLEEATAAGMAEDVFTAADADGNGELNADEFATIAQ